MLWSYYRPLIIKWKLFPFLIYLGIQNYVTLIGSEIIDELKAHHHKPIDLAGEPTTFQNTYYTIIVGCFLIEFYWFWNFFSECKEWRRDGLDYFKDIWNFLDVSIIVVTQIYMVQFMGDFLLQRDWFRVAFVRTCGGMTLFLLWIKCFYWMRLFSQTAYFIKLIQRTIADLK